MHFHGRIFGWVHIIYERKGLVVQDNYYCSVKVEQQLFRVPRRSIISLKSSKEVEKQKLYSTDGLLLQSRPLSLDYLKDPHHIFP